MQIIDSVIYVCSICHQEVGPPDQGVAVFPKKGYGHLPGSTKKRGFDKSKNLFCWECWDSTELKVELSQNKLERIQKMPVAFQFLRKIILQIGWWIFSTLVILVAIAWVWIVTHFGGFWMSD